MRFEKLAIEIPTGTSHIHRIERFIEEICDKYHIGNELYGNITAAIMEAVENSMVHGNRMDKSKMISIRFEAKPGELIFQVRDEGSGYNFNLITDPTDTSTSSDGIAGRGLYIIRKLTDGLRFNEQGNLIELHFKTSGIDDLTELERRKKMESFLDKTKTHTAKHKK
jgi:serine/threonine-protein kinase RsbW